MRFTTSKDNLNTAVNAVQRAINPKSIIPVYSCIKIDVKDNMAVFTGTGLDVSIECSIPVQTDLEGSALVSAKFFGDIIRKLPDMPITIEHTESMEMAIRYEKSIFTLRTTLSNDFPPFGIFKGGLDFNISAEAIKKLIRQSSFAASPDEVKNVFTGLLWEIDGEDISVIGTDTHRLAWVKGKIKNNEIVNDDEIKGSFIIPSRIASDISRLVQDGVCHVQADNNTVYFTFDNIKINCRILEGVFPNFRQVIPEKFITEIQVENRLLRDAADRIALFSTSNDTSSTINIEINEGVMSIHSRSDIGFGREEFPVEHNGEDISIAFNSRYITDIFKVTDGNEVNLKFSGQLSAGIMRDKEDDDFIYLILPIKV